MAPQLEGKLLVCRAISPWTFNNPFIIIWVNDIFTDLEPEIIILSLLGVPIMAQQK